MTRIAVLRPLAALAILAATAGAARAQTPDVPDAPYFRIGPAVVQPRLELRDVGVDDNVFNDAEHPRRDFTATIAPRLDARMRLGWTRLSAGAFSHFVYFRDFEDERSIDRGADVRFEVGEGLVRPYVLGSLADTRERLNPEIDARARRRQSLIGGGVSLALTGRTSLVLHARRSTTAFDEGETFRGVALDRGLNERASTVDAGFRLELTPLTAWETTFGVQRDRFEIDARRDADSRRVITALEFSPSALISGRAAVGYRRFTPVDPSLAEHTGAIALVTAAYAVEDTKVEAAFERDVRYSFENTLPYYLTTNGRLTVTRRVAGPVDVQATAGRYSLSYRAFGLGDAEARRDGFTVYGAGIGFRLSRAARFGVNAEWSRRRSDAAADREYDRRRVFSTLTYGY